MDKIIQTIKDSGGRVEVIRITERDDFAMPITEGIFRAHYGDKIYTVLVIASPTHCAACVERYEAPIARPHSVQC